MCDSPFIPQIYSFQNVCTLQSSTRNDAKDEASSDWGIASVQHYCSVHVCCYLTPPVHLSICSWAPEMGQKCKKFKLSWIDSGQHQQSDLVVNGPCNEESNV